MRISVRNMELRRFFASLLDSSRLCGGGRGGSAETTVAAGTMRVGRRRTSRIEEGVRKEVDEGGQDTTGRGELEEGKVRNNEEVQIETQTNV